MARRESPTRPPTESTDPATPVTTARRTIRLDGPLDLRATVAALRIGRGDPTMRLAGDELARATWTVAGPATLHLRLDASAGDVHATAAGPGAEVALEQAPALVGADDDRSDFDPECHEVVVRLDRRRPGLRIGRTGRVADVLLPTVLAQKVTGGEAVRAFQFLAVVADRAAPALPEAPDLLLPPASEWLAHTPTWQYTAAGVDRKRAVTIIESHRRIDRLEEALAMDAADARTRLTAIRGIGPWTAAIVERLAGGDPDAVEVGDFHLPNTVAWTLAREPRADDDRMLELLEPFTGHRGRVARLCELEGQFAPRRGPRYAPRRFGARRPPRRT